jgi:hypothetical protein
MKKILYILLFLISFYTLANAQCIPNTYSGNHGYILPDSTQFPHGKVDTAFDAVIQIQVAHDTVISLGTFTFDSIFITSVTTQPALPNGATISYTCSATRCSFLGASTGCVNVHIDSIGMTAPGTYRIIVNATAKGALDIGITVLQNQSQSATIDWYKLIVDGNGTGIVLPNNFDESKFAFIDVKPNPANNEFTFNYFVPKNSIIGFTITDMIGRTIANSSVSASKGLNSNKVDVSNYANGVYFLTIDNDGKKLTKKISISH